EVVTSHGIIHPEEAQKQTEGVLAHITSRGWMVQPQILLVMMKLLANEFARVDPVIEVSCRIVRGSS
ncbi:hypothetical protein HAX54_029278, partial [Datura stramonium]|nr:hypothetical protein [Datura stramonium]